MKQLLRPPVQERICSISVATKTDVAFQRCVSPDCGMTYALDEVRVACQCGQLLDVAYDWERLSAPKSLKWFEEKWSRRYDPLCFSGVWRFRELLPFAPPEMVVTIGEGQTLLQLAPAVGKYVGLNSGQLHLQY